MFYKSQELICNTIHHLLEYMGSIFKDFFLIFMSCLIGKLFIIDLILNDFDCFQAYRWSVEALKQVKPGLPSRVTIDVLRQVAKSCVVKREFKRAGLLARQAVNLTKEVFDKDHPKYSDSLLDFGFFLLNFDSIRQSVVVYEVCSYFHCITYHCIMYVTVFSYYHKTHCLCCRLHWILGKQFLANLICMLLLPMKIWPMHFMCMNIVLDVS